MRRHTRTLVPALILAVAGVIVAALPSHAAIGCSGAPYSCTMSPVPPYNFGGASNDIAFPGTMTVNSPSGVKWSYVCMSLVGQKNSPPGSPYWVNLWSPIGSRCTKGGSSVYWRPEYYCYQLGLPSGQYSYLRTQIDGFYDDYSGHKYYAHGPFDSSPVWIKCP